MLHEWYGGVTVVNWSSSHWGESAHSACRPFNPCTGLLRRCTYCVCLSKESNTTKPADSVSVLWIVHSWKLTWKSMIMCIDACIPSLERVHSAKENYTRSKVRTAASVDPFTSANNQCAGNHARTMHRMHQEAGMHDQSGYGNCKKVQATGRPAHSPQSSSWIDNNQRRQVPSHHIIQATLPSSLRQFLLHVLDLI